MHNNSQYSFPYDIQIFDTDCYGVMWHGSHTKWFEMGRVKLLEKLTGQHLKDFSDEHDIIFPVYEQQFKYLKQVKFGDTLSYETSIELALPRMIFTQRAYLLDKLGKTNDEKVLAIDCQTIITPITTSGRICRKLPDNLTKALS